MMAMTSVLSLGKSTGTKGALCAYGSFIRVILAPVVRSTGIAKRGEGESQNLQSRWGAQILASLCKRAGLAEV